MRGGGREFANKARTKNLLRTAGPAKNIVARVGSGRKKFWCERDRPEIFLHEPVLSGFFQKPEQPDAITQTSRVQRGGAG